MLPRIEQNTPNFLMTDLGLSIVCNAIHICCTLFGTNSRQELVLKQ